MLTKYSPHWHTLNAIQVCVNLMLEFGIYLGFFPYGLLTHMGCSPIQNVNPYRILTNMGYSPIWDAYSYGIFTHNESSPIWDIHQYWYSPIRTFSSMDVHPYRTFIHTDILPFATFTHMWRSNIWEITHMVVHTYMMFTHMWRTTIQDILQSGTFNMKLQVVHLLWLEPPEIRAT